MHHSMHFVVHLGIDLDFGESLASILPTVVANSSLFSPSHFHVTESFLFVALAVLKLPLRPGWLGTHTDPSTSAS